MKKFKAEVTVDERGIQFGKNYWVSQESIVGNISPKFFLEWREAERRKAEAGDRHRGTGRTTRMLNYALDQSLVGKKVCILGAGLNHIQDLADMLGTMKRSREEKHPGLFNHTPKIILMSGRLIDLRDFDARPIAGGHNFDEVLYDHFTISTSIEKAVGEMHRWDEDAPNAQAVKKDKLQEILEILTNAKEVQESPRGFCNRIDDVLALLAELEAEKKQG